jgi:pimeloyl-ACP methyl ester carboxylesterase
VKSMPVLLGNRKGLFGVLTAADQVPGRFGIIILNAGLLHNVGPFRLHVELANVAMECGIPTIRIDQSGKGESRSRSTESRLEALFQDYEDAFGALAETGVEATILVGLCSGADDALQVAGRYDSVAGLVLLDGYARRTAWLRLRNLARRIRHKATDRIRSVARRDTHEDPVDIDLRAWNSDEEMLGLMRRLLDSGKRIMAVFTAGQGYYDHAGQLAHSLAATHTPGNLHEIYFKEADHTYSRVAHREALLEQVRSWLAEHFHAEA